MDCYACSPGNLPSPLRLRGNEPRRVPGRWAYTARRLPLSIHCTLITHSRPLRYYYSDPTTACLLGMSVKKGCTCSRQAQHLGVPRRGVAWLFGRCLELHVVAAENDADGEVFYDEDEVEDGAERGGMLDHLDSLLQMPRADDLDEASHLPAS